MKFTKSLLIAGASLMLAAPVFAQTTQPDPGHPRVNEVEQRIDNQEKRIEQGEASGKLTEKQADRLEKRDAKIESQLNKDEAKHNGHITKAEQRKLNKKLDHNSKRIRHKKHEG